MIPHDSCARKDFCPLLAPPCPLHPSGRGQLKLTEWFCYRAKEETDDLRMQNHRQAQEIAGLGKKVEELLGKATPRKAVDEDEDEDDEEEEENEEEEEEEEEDDDDELMMTMMMMMLMMLMMRRRRRRRRRRMTTIMAMLTTIMIMMARVTRQAALFCSSGWVSSSPFKRHLLMPPHFPCSGTTHRCHFLISYRQLRTPEEEQQLPREALSVAHPQDQKDHRSGCQECRVRSRLIGAALFCRLLFLTGGAGHR